MTTSKLLLVKFKASLYYAQLDGLLLIEAEKLQRIYDETPEVYMGECSGKHSEVIIKLNDKNLTVLSDDAGFIAKLQSILDIPLEAIDTEGCIFGSDPIEPLTESGFFDEAE